MPVWPPFRRAAYGMACPGGPYEGEPAAIALPHPPAMLDGVASQEAERTYDVPLDCLSRRNDPAGTVRDRPGALAGGAESAGAGIDRRHQRRRLRHGLVRRARRTRALSRGPPGVVRRESALPVPPHPLAPLFRACARRDRHADHAPELPSLCLRPLAVHAQRHDRQLGALAAQGGSADSRRVLRLAHRHDRFGSGLPRHPRRRRRQGSGRRHRACARDADRDGQHRRLPGAAALHGGARQRARSLRLPLRRQRQRQLALLPGVRRQRGGGVRAARCQSHALEAGAARPRDRGARRRAGLARAIPGGAAGGGGGMSEAPRLRGEASRQELSRIVKPTCLPLQHTGANARAMNAAIENIRNFAIIAHIDHGKSTLADRLIQSTGGLAEREMVEQVLDSMDIERERGITIKAQTVRLNYRARDGKDYVLNLIDTPGHVDFAYEVNRSLAACEGSLLVVDASQGVEAQTLANVYQALDNNHEVVPVLNKVDLPAAEPDKVRQQIEDVIGLDASNAILISAKTGQNIEEVLDAIVTRLPPPKGDKAAPLKALLVDSWYDVYLGVVVLVRIVDGTLKKNQRIRMMGTGAAYEVDRVGVFTPKMQDRDELGPGEIGFITASIKEVADTRVGDTITDDRKPTETPLPGFRPAQPVVFCGLFPVDAADFEALRAAIAKLRLNDASFTYEMETSAALGFGFRCGFLGLLHLEIIQERLARVFNLDLIATAPSVIYKMKLNNGTMIEIHNPVDMPDPMQIEEINEPWIEATILTPDEYLGSVLKLCQDRRGSQKELTYVGSRAMVKYDLPLNEVVFDFY